MFGGSMVAVVTPMTTEGAIDFVAWERLLHFHAEQGTDGLIVGGTTGESPTLSNDELLKLTEIALRILRGRMPVIAGAGSNVTAHSVERARLLSKAGADALLVVTPYYNKPVQEGLYQHFRAVAEASTVPVILYNVPGRTGVDLLPETVHRLAKLPRIAGIKEAVPSVERARAILAGVPAGFELYSGDDPTAYEMMRAGAKGVISVTANVIPKLMHEFCAATLAGDLERAQALDSRLQPVHQSLFLESNPIPAKWLLNRMGLIGDGLRLPLTPLALQHHATLEAVFKAADIALT